MKHVKSAYIFLLAVAVIGLLGAFTRVHAGSERVVGSAEITLYGVGLTVEPARQTVPKDIATIVSTYLTAPALPAGMNTLPEDAVVVGTLRGPSFPTPIELSVSPNSQFHIPPMTVPGTHTLESIRVISAGAVLMQASPESVVFEVIDKLLVSQITARPLTAEEIREKGIVFDKSNFQAYNFSAAFAVAPGEEIRIDMPVVLPTLASTADVQQSTVAVPELSLPQLKDLSTIIPESLKLVSTVVPNLSVKGFTLKPITLESGQFMVPPIPGVVVIPGDIGFLNQYFSVLLMVGNVAPDGSNLVVRDLMATISLPAGNDTVVGTSDDPLKMAITERGEAPRVSPVAKAGPDGKPGTADDINFIAPGESGNAEFLVEGRREGTHALEMEISGTLEGLPVGPVTVRGRAAGSVLVRNPSFTLTFTHPDVVSAGEEYTIDITVTNTSSSPANFVSLNLFDRNLSGATLIGDSSKQIESIAPGDSDTVTFTLRSKVSGTVFAATLDSDDKVAGRFELKSAVGELGIPVSPDSLVLPKEAGSLPVQLRNAAIGLLGKAYAAATAPGGSLPKDVRRFSRQIVWDRAIEVAGAGFRYSLHEPLVDTVKHLLLDFAGNNYAWLSETNTAAASLKAAKDDYAGFDDLRRRSVRGDVFATAAAAVLGPDLASMGVEAFHRDFAEKVSFRPSHISVVVGSAGAPLPISLSVADSAGRGLGGAGTGGKVVKDIPFGDYLAFNDASGAVTGQMAVIASPQPGEYTVKINRAGDGEPEPYTISIVYPGPDGLKQAVYNLSGAETPEPFSLPGDEYRISFAIDTGADAPQPKSFDAALEVADPLPTVLSVVQQADADKIVNDCGQWRFGRVVAVLFSEKVTKESVQDRFSRELITNYSPEANRVVGVALQPGGRIAFLALRDPVGPFIERQMQISGVAESSGRQMAAWTGPIEATLFDQAGVVSGAIMKADGTPVDGAEARLFTRIEVPLPNDGCMSSWYGVSSKRAGADASYSWDYVLKGSPAKIVAIDPETEVFRPVVFSIGRNGQRLNVNVVFLGRGVLKGRTLAEDGLTPLADTAIRVTSLTDMSEYGGRTDSLGEFFIADVPVGNFLIEAVNTVANASATQSDYIGSAGSVVTRDLILFGTASTAVTTRYGKLSGYVLRSGGSAPASGLPVIAYYKSLSQPGVVCPGGGRGECAVAVSETDSTGAFFFDNIVAGDLKVYSFDQAEYTEGDAWIPVPIDGEASVKVILSGGYGSVSGIVLDSDGNPVAEARVGGGVSLTTTDTLGEFILSDVPSGRRSIVAVSDALGAQGSALVDVASSGEETRATIVLDTVGAVAGTVFRADGTTPVAGLKVYLLEETSGGTSVVATADTGPTGSYRIDKVRKGSYTVSAFLSDLSDGNIAEAVVNFSRQVVKADVVFRGGGGRINGVIYDDDGVTPLKARVSVSGLKIKSASGGGALIGLGFERVQHYSIKDTDLTTGRFSFDGVFAGSFVITAAGPFSPDPVTISGLMPSAGATVDVALRLQPTSRIQGTLFMPDGVTPVGRDFVVTYKSEEFRLICDGSGECASIPQGIQEEVVVTDDTGKFLFPVVNPGRFTITAVDPASIRTAKVSGVVQAGQTGEVSMRLNGIGAVVVNVLGSDSSTVIPGARVTIEQTSHPNISKTGVADSTGSISFSGADSFTEGQFVVLAEDLVNGFAGRASGRITKDGELVTVNVYLYNATGRVYGTVFRPDGFTPVPNAEVAVSNAQGALAFAVTDSSGGYSLDYIPLGRINLEVFEAATGRRGSAAGSIDLAGQEIPINIVESAVGLVMGTLLDSAGFTPLSGWEMSFEQTLKSGQVVSLRSTTGIDGVFSFPGVPVGTFRLHTYKTGIGSAAADGRLIREGEAIDIPVLASLVRPSEGRVSGIVFNPNGSLAQNIQVCLDHCGAQTTTDDTGAFAFDAVLLGRHRIIARSQSSGGDSGSTLVEVVFAGETAYASVTLAGLGSIRGTAIRADASVVAFAKAEIAKYPDAGCGSGVCIVYADADGLFSFSNVPSGTYTVTVTEALTGLSGSQGGLMLPGATADLTVTIERSASIGGRVIMPDGAAAPGVIAELKVAGRTLYAETGPDGLFFFASVPAEPYTIAFTDSMGSGIAAKSGSGAASGAIDLGDISLDVSVPEVASISPVNGGAGVERAAPVRITFSEPISPGSVTAASIRVSSEAGTVTGFLSVSDADTVVTFTPLAQLANETRYTVRVSGVNDRLGRPMSSAFVSNFVTADITAPSFIDIGPAPGVSGAPVYSVVRVRYSEPVNPSMYAGGAITVMSPSGAVAGKVDMILGNTGAVFTPLAPLDENTSYSVSVMPATDLSGNAQASGLSYVFSTTDRTPPVIAAIVGPVYVISGGLAAVTAQPGLSGDVQFVDFYLNGVLSYTARSEPFSLSFVALPSLGSAGKSIKISAVATDTSGNRGVETVSYMSITPDAPPVPVITAPVEGQAFPTGQAVNVTIQATDDLGLTRIGYNAAGGLFPASGSAVIEPPSVSVTKFYSFIVPPEAVPGSSIIVSATAVDSTGQLGHALPVSVTVLDATAPLVSFTGLTTGSKVKPGEKVTAVVSASDAGGISALNFSVSGAALYNDTRTIDPAQSAVVTSFSFTVPGSAGPTDTVRLSVQAVDAASNNASAPVVVLPVADMVPPVVSVRSASGSTQVLSGKSVVVVVDATDEIGVSRVEITGSGALSFVDAAQVTPPSGSASVHFTINIPADVPAGSTLSVVARAIDISGNAAGSTAAVFTVASLPEAIIPSSTVMRAGQSQTISIGLSSPAPDEGITVNLATLDSAVATVSGPVYFAPGETSQTFVVTGLSGGSATITSSIQGFDSSSMTVTVSGGIVTGSVYDPSGAPVSGVQVNVNGVTATTGVDGGFEATGVNGAGYSGKTVTINAVDTATGLKGHAIVSLNAPRGFVSGVYVALMQAARVSGKVVMPDGVTGAGEGAKVEVFASADMSTPVQTTFTGADSLFEFPLLPLGSYVFSVSDANGNRGMLDVIVTTGADLNLTLAFLGKGTVSGTVFDGANTPVAGASVGIRSLSVFGGTQDGATGPDGSFSFENVFIGGFNLTAIDAVTGMAASASGSIDSNGQAKTVDLTLHSWGSIEGHVYRNDGTTPVAGALVSVGTKSVTADTNGYYRFDVLRLGSYNVRAYESATSGGGERSVTLTVQGEIKVQDIVFNPQGSAAITVVDSFGSIVSGASVNVSYYDPIYSYSNKSGTTGTDGIVVINYITAGTFNVNAYYSGYSGTGSGTVSAGGLASVTVALEPVASVMGVVYGPDAAARSGVKVSLRNYVSTTTGADGSFSFAGVRLGTYTLEAYDANGYVNAREAELFLNANGQVLVKDLNIVPYGSVTGRVLMPDSSSAQNIPVTVRSLSSEFARTFSVYTDAAGYYTVNSIPQGKLTVSAGSASLRLLGEGTGIVTVDGETVTVDIILQNNAVTMPYDLLDGNLSRFNVQANGTLFRGINNNVFNYAADKPGLLLEIASGASTQTFAGSSFATQEDGRRELVVRQDNIGNLNITRKIYVPQEGYFARYLEILTNPTSSPISVGVKLRSFFYATGSNSARSMVATSSGDAALAPRADNWAVIDDADATDPYLMYDSSYNSSPTAFLWDSPGASAPVDNAVMTPRSGSYWSPVPEAIFFGWDSITVAPGESVALMHFVVQHATREAAVASVERLAQYPPEALHGLSASELAMVKNLNLPADGSSALAPLPSLNASVTGRALAHDGVTSPPHNAFVALKSDNIYFSRSYTAESYGSASFNFASNVLTSSYPTIGLPAEGFTITARAYRDWYESYSDSYYSSVRSRGVLMETHGTFASGQVSATQNVVFNSAGIIRGNVTTFTGSAVSGASISGAYGTVNTLADGSFVLGFQTPGRYTLSATKSHPQGTSLTATAVIDVLAGITTDASIIMPAVGGVTGTVYYGSGSIATYARVYLERTNASYYANTGGSGQFTFYDIPEGAYTLRVTNPLNWQNFTMPVIISGGATATQNVTLPFSGKFYGNIYLADGVSGPANTNITVEVVDPATGSVLASRYVSGGYYDTGSFNSSASSLVLRLRYSYYQGWTYVSGVKDIPVSGFTSDNQQVLLNLTLPFNIASVRTVVQSLRGTPFTANTMVEVLNPADNSVIGNCYFRGECTIYNQRAYADGLLVRLTAGTYIAEQIVPVTASNTTVTASFSVPYLAGTVSGRVFAGDGVTPVTAQVAALRSDGSVAYSTYSGSGYYNISGLLAGATERFIIRASYSEGSDSAVSAEGSVSFEASDNVNLDLTLPLNTVSGTVYAGDGATPISGAIIRIIRDSDGYVVRDEWTGGGGEGDAGGRYSTSYPFIATPETYTVRAELSVSGRTITAEQSVVFASTGESRVIDFVLPAAVVTGTVYRHDGITQVLWPSVFVTQTDASGNVSTFYANISNADGVTYTAIGLEPGGFEVTAQDTSTGLAGTAAGSVADVSTPASADVILGPSGTVSGTVYNLDGTVAPSAAVTITLGTSGISFTTWAGQDGTYGFSDVPVSSFTLVARANYPPYNRYSQPVAGSLTSHGETAVIDITIDDLAIVNGYVYDRNGAPVPAGTDIELSNQALGWSTWVYTGDGGWFDSGMAVPPGVMTATAYHGSQVGTGTITISGYGTYALNLTTDGIYLGTYNLDGSDGFRYDVGSGGGLSDGGTANRRLSDSYDGAYWLYVNGSSFNSNSSVVRLEDGDRELSIGPAVTSNLQVTRKVFVPVSGGFARYLDIVHNPGPDTAFRLEVRSNLGSDGGTRVHAEPVMTGEYYAVTFENGRYDPALGHVFGGAGALYPPYTYRFINSDDDIYYLWSDIPIAAGETRCFMHFAIQNEPNNEAAVDALARALSALTNSDALSGMSAEERACVVNYNIAP